MLAWRANWKNAGHAFGARCSQALTPGNKLPMAYDQKFEWAVAFWMPQFRQGDCVSTFSEISIASEIWVVYMWTFSPGELWENFLVLWNPENHGYDHQPPHTTAI
jgi:hypothetical protein